MGKGGGSGHPSLGMLWEATQNHQPFLLGNIWSRASLALSCLIFPQQMPSHSSELGARGATSTPDNTPAENPLLPCGPSSLAVAELCPVPLTGV